MLRYSLYRPKLVKLNFIFILISFAFSVYVIVDIFTLRSYQGTLDHLVNTDISQLFCSQICSNLPQQVTGNCCSLDNLTCEPKQTCLESTISNYQTQIDTTNNFIYYFSIPAFFFFVAFLVTLIYCLILRKKSINQQEMFAFEQALLANQQAFVMEEEEDQFGSYQDFVQYMIENGYLIEPKKKGDANITASFGTVDDNMCPICMMEYSGQKVLRLKCDHKFHSGCIRDWNKENSTCPICRADIYQ